MDPKKIARNTILTGVAGGILALIAAIAVPAVIVSQVHWVQLPSPPEEVTALLQMLEGGVGIVQVESGAAYSCGEGQAACRESGFTPEEVARFAVCQHVDLKEEGIRSPSSRSGEVVEACKQEFYSEIVYTYYLALCEDNSLWLGEKGGTSLPMYGAGCYLILAFLLGGLISCALGYAFFRLRAKRT